MSDATSKGKLSAYQRWEMTSFEEPKPAAAKVSTEALLANNKAELDRLKLKAQKEGFAQGFEEGHKTGLGTGQLEMQHELATILKLSTQFNLGIQHAEQIVAQEVLDLALDIAKAMLKGALEIDPALIIPVIEQAIASLPSVQQPAQLFLNPKDAELVKQKVGAELGETGWVIVNDLHMNQGDCRIETLKNQIDASLQSRWQQLTDALGRDNSWYVRDLEQRR
ncbi:flagellar assembly protein FliH [Oxalobacteraceae bacterium GrIS 2.11]